MRSVWTSRAGVLAGPSLRWKEVCCPFIDARQERLIIRGRSVSRKYVDKLQQRIETLEALNQPPSSLSAGRPNEDGAIPPANVSEPLGGPNTIPSANAINATLSYPSDASGGATSRTTQSSQRALPVSNMGNGYPPQKVRDESPTFYGVTSHPHVTSPGEESRLPDLEEADTVGIELDPHSPNLRDHLIQAFFKYQTLWVDVVDSQVFLAHQKNGTPSRWYSTFLENAMLACGTRLSTSKVVRALGSTYCEWAKEETLTAMTDPTPANLQGFLLLSEYEVTQGNDRPGWMFCGVACRMLSDLGLHELADNSGASEEQLEPNREMDLAYALLSACIVYEGVWTLYLGRPSSIPRSVMSIAASRCRAGRKSDSPMLNAWVGLCVPMAEVSHVLNEETVRDSDATASLRKLFKQMEDWYDGLPPQLAYDGSRLTNMDLAGFGLHTQYCKVQILLRQALARPANPRKRHHSQITGDQGSRMPFDDSDAMIYQYALRIARLVVTYREAFGVEKIPSIMLDNAVVAATAMIGHFNKPENACKRQHETTWLRQLVKSMATVQPHFPIIGRMLDTLRQIGGGGPLSAIFPSPHPSTSNAPGGELTAQSQYHNFGPQRYDVQGDPGALGKTPDALWDAFDIDMSPSVFFSAGFGDSMPGLPQSESLTSSFAQNAT